MSWQKVKEIKQKLSRETGAIVRNWGGKLPVALVYPNSYQIGMSNLGIQSIYSFLNSFSDVVCERAFWSPGDSNPVLALESQRPLTDFAVIAFSVSYELDYFNVVQAMRGSGLPLYAKDRNEMHPLVIAGGPCITANPMPLVPFFDCLCIGEGEAILPPMLPVLKEGASEDREELLKKLSDLPGVYVPGHTRAKVNRQWVRNLDVFPVVSAVLTPDTELGDMYLIEVQRGCKWGCRFCLVSNTFKPVRFRSLESVVGQAKIGLNYRKKLGLVGPSVTDHPRIEELVTTLRGIGAEISVSSLRIKPLLPLLIDEMVKGGAGTVALAPEAGSQRLRNYINKGIDENDILTAVEKVAGQGIRQLKLYFMIGLPTETDDDIQEMASLAIKCKEIMDRQSPGGRIVMTVAPFVPKAGTHFERQGMSSLDDIRRRLSLLKDRLSGQGISIKNESADWSEVQAALSRGDEKLADVLAEMKKNTLAEWHRAAKSVGIDTESYAHEMWDNNKTLPWNNLP